MKEDDPIIGGWHWSTRCGNGSYEEWIEYQAECNRDPREFLGAGNPDPKYDMAPLCERRTFPEVLFINAFDRWCDEYDKKHGVDSTDIETGAE